MEVTDAAPTGWDQDSQTLYVHESGVRIERRLYRDKEGWFLVPADLDRAVIKFPPDGEGLAQAFAAFAKGVLAPQRPDSKKAAEESEEASEEPTDEDAEDQGDE